MTTSADYRVFAQAESEEQKRLAGVYQGVESEGIPPVEHINVDHLDRLLSTPMSREFRAHYMHEYLELRACLRAIAVCGLTRKDFYDSASHEALRDSRNLDEALSQAEYNASMYLDGLSEKARTMIEEMQADYEARKSAITARLKAEGGVPSEHTLTDQDLVRDAMEGIDGVNVRGVSTLPKRVR